MHEKDVNTEIISKIEEIILQKPIKMVLSASKQDEAANKAVLTMAGNVWQLEEKRNKQAFHENIAKEALAKKVCEKMESQYNQLTIFTKSADYGFRITKKGRLLTNKTKPSLVQTEQKSEHDRQKKYLLEGVFVPALVDMGVQLENGQVVKAMYDKYRQINRFVELIDDALKTKTFTKLKVIDFGCGKSYLTFVLYHFLTKVRKTPTQMLGLDLKEDVVAKCNMAAKKYGYEGLSFETGDIKSFNKGKGVDMVISLHACDTATDFALARAVKWGASMIFSVPCCQHELNGQLKTENFGILQKYGIIKERTAALMTDAIRANLLEWQGYKTQVLEFVDFTHTPKNLLIRAIKANIPQKKKEAAFAEVQNLCKEFNLNPCLKNLLCEDML